VSDEARAFAIAITGGTGSGKTTLARALCARLGADAALLTEDNYYRPRAEQHPPVAGLSAAEVERLVNFDDPRAKDMELFGAHVRALRAMQPIEQPVYDFAQHDRIHDVRRIEPRRFLIVEGVHVLSGPEFTDLFDLTVFVDAAADLRLARRIRRDRAERGRDPERVIEQYLRFVRPSHQRYTEPAKYACDLVLADEGPAAFAQASADAVAVERLLAPVWSRLAARGLVAPLA
jgi:uridine kinase